MVNQKKLLLAVLGALFFIAGIYYENLNFQYIGAGTWLAGVIFFTLFPGYKEITSIILGLIVLHSGVLLILKENISNIKLVGFLVFTIGIIFVLNSGFSDYMKKRIK